MIIFTIDYQFTIFTELHQQGYNYSKVANYFRTLIVTRSLIMIIRVRVPENAAVSLQYQYTRSISDACSRLHCRMQRT